MSKNPITGIEEDSSEDSPLRDSKLPSRGEVPGEKEPGMPDGSSKDQQIPIGDPPISSTIISHDDEDDLEEDDNDEDE